MQNRIAQTYSSRLKDLTEVQKIKINANPNAGYLRLLVSAATLYMAFSGYEALEKIAIISILIKDILSAWKNTPIINNHRTIPNTGNHEDMSISAKNISIFSQISLMRIIGKPLMVGGAALIGLYANRIPGFKEIKYISGGLKDAVRSSAIISTAIQLGESIINLRQEKPKKWLPSFFICNESDKGEHESLSGIEESPISRSYGSHN